ncbi:MAG: polyprenyl synthetase family protein [Myxococcota bacterium]|nr:polyprenyl synthetase family protein [Myxococcota bacterium]
MDARAYLLERVPLVERALESALPRPDEPPSALHRAMRHLVFPAGKRLRPVLSIAAAEAVGAPPERALPFAVGVELVHTYSLVHDDLPCMDDDVERRGRPTVHVAFDEPTAVLAGDALLALAFETVARAPADAVSSACRLQAVAELSRAAGSRELVGGQSDDLGLDPAVATADHVESIHLRKTAALITSAIVGGALFGGAAADQVATLRRFGLDVGLAFQIADDLLDADEEDHCSLVALLGADAARSRGEELLASALDGLGAFGEAAEPLRALALFALRRKE